MINKPVNISRPEIFCFFNNEGNINVNGVGYNGIMPKHSFLTNEEAAGVLTYIRKNFGNKDDEITAKEVEKQRNKLNNK